jgi:GNAT superfamily N-acetyltransferase
VAVTEIRAAAVADARALAELRWEFRTTGYDANEAHDTFVRRCTAWMLRELQDASSWKVWAAVDDEEIVGQVWLHVIEKIPNPIAELERLAYVSNLYVRPSARGGIGTRLLEGVLDWCRANEIDRVVLWPTKRSMTLYMRHGFARDGDVMELKIRSS